MGYIANGITYVTYLQGTDRLINWLLLNSCNDAYLSVWPVIALVTLDGSKNSIGWPRNSPMPNPKPTNQICRVAKSLARSTNWIFRFGKPSPPNSRYRHGITTTNPTGYRVAAPKPESSPTRKSRCQRWEFLSFNENQIMTIKFYCTRYFLEIIFTL